VVLGAVQQPRPTGKNPSKHSTSGILEAIGSANSSDFLATEQPVDVEIEQLKAGDRIAWNRAWEILYAISLSVCYTTASTLNHQDHEDVAAESITEVVEYIEKVGSFEECKKLVVTISKNRLLDRFRHASAGKRDGKLTDSIEETEGFDPKDESQERPDERNLMLKEGLKQIPEQYRKVVEDFYLKGLKQQEIADKHGLAIGSIGNYLQRGLAALHDILPKDAG
jgi:RNA polymerase sigma-70 factor, ECF subfamily